MTFNLVYASVAYMGVTSVSFKTEADARHWWTRCMEWKDIGRCLLFNAGTGEILGDETIEHRLHTDAHRELVAMLEPTRHATWPPPDAPAPSSRPARVIAADNDVCWCGHGRVQHVGAAGDGRCASPCPCGRFRRKR